MQRVPGDRRSLRLGLWRVRRSWTCNSGVLRPRLRFAGAKTVSTAYEARARARMLKTLFFSFSRQTVREPA